MDTQTLTVISTVITNIPGFPLSYTFWREQEYSTAICGFSLAITSMLYHIGDVLKINDPHTLFMMNAGQWHRLDNVFAILIFNFLNMKLLLKLNQKQEEFARWIILAFTLWCQEKSPWEVIYTIIPILVPMFIMIFVNIFNPKMRPNYQKKNLLKGTILLIIAIYFFIKGLDDENDWIRLNHGLWHTFGSFSFYYFKYSVFSQPDLLGKLN